MSGGAFTAVAASAHKRAAAERGPGKIRRKLIEGAFERPAEVARTQPPDPALTSASLMATPVRNQEERLTDAPV